MAYSPLIGTPLLACVLTAILLLLAIRLFRQWNLLDFPAKYGLMRLPLPYPCGSAAVLAFVLIFPLVQAINEQFLAVMSAVVILGVVSFIDDRRPLSPWLRLAFQILCTLIIVLPGDCTGGRVCSVTNPLEFLSGNPIIDLNGMLPLLAIGVSVIWLLLTINALNWFDGIPGQVTTLSTIGFTVIGLLSLSSRVNQPELALIAFALAGIALACLLFDFPPPTMVLGDTGSMFFGLMLGVLTVYAGGKVATAFLVLGVPLLDLGFVILKRLMDGRSPFRGSMSGEHLHHRLLEKGWKPQFVILLTAGIGTAFGGTALFLDTPGKLAAAALLLCIMLLLWKYSAPVKTKR